MTPTALPTTLNRAARRNFTHATSGEKRAIMLRIRDQIAEMAIRKADHAIASRCRDWDEWIEGGRSLGLHKAYNEIVRYLVECETEYNDAELEDLV